MTLTAFKRASLAVIATGLFLAPALAPAQTNPDTIAAQVKALNNTLIRLYDQQLGASPASAAATRRQAEEAIANRLAALEALIAVAPGRALTLGFSSDFLANLAEAFPGGADNLEQRGVFTGIYEPEYVDGLSSYRLVQGLRLGQRRVELFFEQSGPVAEGGATVTVEGMLAGEAMAGGSVLSATGPEAAAGQACSTFGDQRVAVIKARPAGSTASLPNANIQAWLAGSSGKTVTSFWQENSYGDAWATADVYPAGTDAWYELDQNYICDDYALMRSAAIALADADIDFNNYERVLIMYPHPGGSCFAGIASIGCWLGAPDGSPSISYAIDISNYASTQGDFLQLTTHEMGHNLGLPHSSSIDFGSTPLGPLNSSGSSLEYGDRYSTMGYWNDGHYAAPHKRQLGWLNSYQTVSSAGTYTVVPYSTNGGVQALEIARGTDNTESEELWVEFRRRKGQYYSTVGNPTNGALVHLENGLSGGRTQLVDFTPETSTSCGAYWCNDFYDATLNVGQSWTDAASNLNLTVVSASDSGLQIQVGYGAIQCVPGAPTVTISPSSQTTNEGNAVSYTVSVRNNDNAGCTSSTFNLTSSDSGAGAAAISTSYSSSTLTIAPGATLSSTLTATTGAGSGGSNTVTATATRSGGASESDSASAGLTVLEPSYTVTISMTGNGTIEVDPGTQSCTGGTCAFQYSQSAWNPLTLTAVKTHKKHVFCSWGGDCASAGTGTTCSLTNASDYNVTALFASSCPTDGGGGTGGGGGGGGKGGGGKGGGKPAK